MPKHQILIGATVALLCLLGLYQERWFLANTKKGQWLVRRCGEQRAVWVLRVLLAGGTVFGVLLAVDVIRPLH